MKTQIKNNIWRLALVAGCLQGVVSAQEIVYPDGQVAAWAFDEDTGLVAADSIGQLSGDLVNFAGDDSQWVNGSVDGAIEFNGSNYVVVPDDATIGADLVGGFTVSAWFYSNVDLALSGGNRMLEKGNSFFFLQGVAQGGMNFLVKVGGQNKTAGIGQALDAETWYFITGVFDGENVMVYLDGEMKESIPSGGLMDDAQLPMRIGSDDASSFFNGRMDEVRIWNRPLTGEEIISVFDQTKPKPPEGAPVVVAQPEAVTVYEGGTATFTVEATGAPTLRFLWSKDDEPLRDETTETLVIPFATLDNAGEYKVRVSNDEGEVFSAAVALDVLVVEGLETARVLSLNLDETSGQVASDSSSNGHDVALTGYPDDTSHWVDGQVNGALTFDGFATVGSTPDTATLSALGDEASFSFWIKPTTFGEPEDTGTYIRSTSYLFRKGDHFSVRIVNDPGTVISTIIVRGEPGADNGAVARKAFEINAPQNTVELDAWQHWAMIYRQGTIAFYKDGFRIGDPVEGTLGAPNAEALSIGNYNEFGDLLRNYNGSLDELNIWARPISEAEILELAGKDVSGAPSIEVQPVSAKRLEGNTVKFEVQAAGARPLVYQWMKDGQPIEGANAASLELTRLKSEDAGEYSVVITNSVGEDASNIATLTVEPLDAITSGLVAYYTFDETSGTTLNDNSGNDLHGQLQNFGPEGFTSGIIGGGYEFDGLDDFIVVPHNELLNLRNEATVSIWLKVAGLSDGNDFDRVFRKATNFDFVLINGGITRVHGINKDPYSSPGGNWETGAWIHFAYTFKDGEVQWYKDGLPVGAPISGALGELTTAPLSIGNYAEDLSISRLYLGTMDEMGIWSRPLADSEIAGIYQNGLQGKPLTEEFEPLNIRTIASDGSDVQITFYTPYPTRDMQIQTKGSPDDAEWAVAESLDSSELGEGLFTVTVAAPTSGVAIYRVAALEPPPIFFDDFESGATGWTHGGVEDNWELGTPINGPGFAFSGDNSYATGLDSNFAEFTNAYLRSPEIDLTGANTATLNFMQFLAVDSDPQFHQAIVNLLDPTTLEVISEISLDSGVTSGWEPVSVRIGPDGVGRKVIIEFLLVTDDFNLNAGWYLDDVGVVAE